MPAPVVSDGDRVPVDIEWLRARDDADEVARANDEPLPVGADAGLRMSSWRDIEAAARADPPEALVDGILSAGDTIMLHGYTGAKKSITGLELALAIERSEPFLGHFATRQAHVGICDLESETRRLGGRLPLLLRGHGIEAGDDRLPVFAVGADVRIDTDEGIARLFDIVRVNALHVLVLDTLIRAHRLDENVATAMAELFTRLRELKRRVRDELARTLTIVLIHHAPKPRLLGSNSAETMARGSGDILGQVDVAIYLRNGTDGQVIFELSKNRWGPDGMKFLVNVEGGEDRLRLVYAGSADDAKSKAEAARDYVVEALSAAFDHELARQELLAGAKAAEIGGRTVADVLGAMKAAGEVAVRTVGRAAVYRLTDAGALS